MNQFRYLFGFFFITIGSLLLVHNFYPLFALESVWRLWPSILLLLGISSLVKHVTVKKITHGRNWRDCCLHYIFG